MPVEAAIDDEDIVADEQESSGEDSDNGNGENGEAAGIGIMGRIWRWKWRKVGRRFDFGEGIHGKGGIWRNGGDENG